MLKRTLIPISVFALAIWAGMAATSGEPTRIVDIRVGKHASYDRLVVELERRVDIHTIQEAPDGRFVLELDARPLLPHQTLETPFKRMGSVVIEGVPRGTRIQIESKPRRVRAYHLKNPARIVVDLADPGPQPFNVPRGVEALAGGRPAPPALPKLPRLPKLPTPQEAKGEITKPSERQPPKVPPKPAPVTPEVVPETVAEAAPEAGPKPAAEVAPEAEPKAATKVTPEVAPKTVPEVQPGKPQTGPSAEEPATADSGVVPKRDAYAELAAPRPERTKPVPTPRARRPERPGVRETIPPPAAVTEVEGSPWSRFMRLGAVAVSVILVLLVLGTVLFASYRLRSSRRKHAAAQARATALARPPDAESIGPEEIAGDGDRLDILEKRIDEEVRARMHLEEHVKQLQEEIKVLHDRLHRMGRRSEGAD